MVTGASSGIGNAIARALAAQGAAVAIVGSQRDPLAPYPTGPGPLACVERPPCKVSSPHAAVTTILVGQME
jgi:NAD(P)-dependent dehydrogenase (short-subunit alcohol dehydrogenase family)